MLTTTMMRTATIITVIKLVVAVIMMTSSNGNIFHVTGHLCGELTGQRWFPRTKASDAELWYFFDLRLNKRLSKQSRGWWLETPSHPWWRHRNDDGNGSGGDDGDDNGDDDNVMVMEMAMMILHIPLRYNIIQSSALITLSNLSIYYTQHGADCGWPKSDFKFTTDTLYPVPTGEL